MGKQLVKPKRLVGGIGNRTNRLKQHTERSANKTQSPVSYTRLPRASEEKTYDLSEFRSAIRKITAHIKSERPMNEVGIVVSIDENGIWQSSDIIGGGSKEVQYDFSKYYSRDPEINEGNRFPQGTVHYHPKIDTDLNYLPSLGDVFSSADMAQTSGGRFVCGVVNHAGQATLTIVDKRAYSDHGFEKIIDEYNDAMADDDRKRVLAIEVEGLEYLQKNDIIKIYRV